MRRTTGAVRRRIILIIFSYALMHWTTLCSSSTFFLIGEKGTGKTAYALYLADNNYKGNTASHKFVRETDYQKFVSLKHDKHLALF